MSSDAILIEGVSKTYLLPTVADRSTMLTERLKLMIRSRGNRHKEIFNALSDISLRVGEGEVLGLIGRNGAGKSTLLKVLSRITEPTTGFVELHGRVGSLLEVGTGFHPELTGRENIFLNGSLLGMTQREVASCLDEIVAFAGVERFLDTPVKRYSSGMYVRLAFAVAAHLRVDILLVDEVLAVGDVQFQEKCLGKLREASSSGRTVIFVSHQMQSVAALCSRACLLRDGAVAFDGPVQDAISLYMASYDADAAGEEAHPERRPGTGELRIAKVSCDKSWYRSEDTKTIRVEIRQVDPAGPSCALALGVYDERGNCVYLCDSRAQGVWLDPEDQQVEVTVRGPWLKPGQYRICADLLRFGPIVDSWEGAAKFRISASLPYNGAVVEDMFSYGLTLPDFDVVSEPYRT